MQIIHIDGFRSLNWILLILCLELVIFNLNVKIDHMEFLGKYLVLYCIIFIYLMQNCGHWLYNKKSVGAPNVMPTPQHTMCQCIQCANIHCDYMYFVSTYTFWQQVCIYIVPTYIMTLYLVTTYVFNANQCLPLKVLKPAKGYTGVCMPVQLQLHLLLSLTSD